MIKSKKALFSKELETAKLAAIESGKIQLELFSEKNHVIRKSPKELVSSADVRSEKVIETILKKEFLDFKIFTEEQRIQERYPTGEPFWIVDPLDGTHNFIAGLPFFGTSIAFADLNNFYIGVIYLPVFDLLLWAVDQQGAYCNGKRIGVSNNSDFSKSMVMYDNQFYLTQKSFMNYQALVENSFTTRIIGSAVYDIYLVASGKVDARVWNNTKICDIASGVTLISEAGGFITNFKGRHLSLSEHNDVIASNAKVHNQIMGLIS